MLEAICINLNTLQVNIGVVLLVFVYEACLTRGPLLYFFDLSPLQRDLVGWMTTAWIRFCLSNFVQSVPHS